MVSSHGDVFLTDFGISRVVEGRVVTSSIIGTVPYMAPETFDGVVCVQSDLFAAGLILHELLSGERVHPKGATVLEVKDAYKRGVPKIDVDVHPQLETLRQMLLQIDVDERLPSASDALDALARVENIDRHDELSELYLRLIGPPHTGLTQYLQAMDSQGSFLPAYFQERERAMGARSTVSVRGAVEGAEPEGPGHTVAVSDEELRALREGRGDGGRASSPESLPEAAIPTPSHVLHASTEPVESESFGRAEVDVVGGKRARAGVWLGLGGVLLVAIGAGAGIGYAWFRPSAEAEGAQLRTAKEGAMSRDDAPVEVDVEPKARSVEPKEVAAVAANESKDRAEAKLDVGGEVPLAIPEATPFETTDEPVGEAEQGRDEQPPQQEEEPSPAEVKEPEAASRKPKQAPSNKVVFYVGANHPAAAVKVGRKRHSLTELRGEPVFEELLSSGRVKLSFCDGDGACERYGVIRVPELGPSESLFVNLRHDKPRVQRRGK